MHTYDDLWMRRAVRSDARAATRGDVLAPGTDGLTRYPRYVDRCQGAYVWDLDGSRYIDYLLGYGPVILGHCHPEITQAVIAELARGNCFAPLWSTRQVELTERLCALIPGAEQALLLKTGSDATSAAVRLARIASGRDHVLRWGYNGWHDWSVHQAAGVPIGARGAEFDLYDLDGLEHLLSSRPVACVVTMPFEDEMSPAGHLLRVRDLAHRHGALLILDEMRSGFRIALGGAQEFLGVQADLATFSKALGNGYSISAVTGSAELMAGLRKTKVSSTFFANPADMAAALTTLDLLERSDAIQTIWDRGTELVSGMNSIISSFEAPAQIVGYPPMPFMRFAAGEDQLRDAFFAEATRRGLLLHPAHQWFISAAHTRSDIDATLEACEVSMRRAVAAA